MKYYRSQLNRGQAFSEYMILIPAAIMVIISVSAVAGFLTTSLGKTVDAFEPYGLTCEVPDEGDADVPVGPHQITLVSHTYNPDDDTTTVTYRVVSGCQPTISHWTLGMPQHVRDNILEVSNGEAVEYGLDPTTGVTGIKFDTGYEGNCDSGNNDNEGGNPRGNNGGGNRGNGNAWAPDGTTFLTSASFKMQNVASSSTEDIDEVSREVTLLISGNYDFGNLDVAVKAGENVDYGTISGPISYHDPSLDETCVE